MPQVRSICLTRRGAIAGFLAPFVAVAPVVAAEPAGDVEAVRGDATAQTGPAIRRLAQNAAVFVGDTVATAAQSAIALRLGSPQHREAVNEKRVDDPQVDRFGVGIVHMSIIRDAEARSEEEADF